MSQTCNKIITMQSRQKGINILQTWDVPEPEEEREATVSNFPEKTISIFSSEPLSVKPRLERPKKKEGNIVCIICMERKPAGRLTKCQHKIMCLKCAQDYVASQVRMECVPTCLIEYCKAELSTSQDSILFDFSQRTIQNWRAFQMKSSLKHSGFLHKCQRPDCPGYIQPGSHYCQICKGKHCDKCHRVSHPGQCMGISANLLNVDNIKFCKFCSMKVSKEGGCPKIACPACRKVICYECLTQWSFSHHGCADNGWLSLPYNFFSEACCSDSTVSRNQIVIDS